MLKGKENTRLEFSILTDIAHIQLGFFLFGCFSGFFLFLLFCCCGVFLKQQCQKKALRTIGLLVVA